MELPLRKTGNKQVTVHSRSTFEVVDAAGAPVGWIWWDGGNGGSYRVAIADGREVVGVSDRTRTITAALDRAGAVLGPPPAVPETAAPAAAPVRGRRELARPDAPVVPRVPGRRRMTVEVGLHRDEKAWLQEQADTETGGNLAELIRRRALRGMPGRG